MWRSAQATSTDGDPSASPDKKIQQNLCPTCDRLIPAIRYAYRRNMPRRTRYQQGSVQCEKRRSGSDVWVFRWWQSTSDGGSKRRKAIVGTIAALPTEAAALRAAQALRIDANQETPQTEGGPSTIAELVAHYRLKELAGEDQGRKAFSTRAAYECYLKTWVLPRWGTHRLDQIKPVAVEEWLGGIKRAKGTKAKIRNLMSALFHHAMRYEWIERNPIKLVRQSAKREKVPDVLELHELQLLLSKLAVRERTLALVDAATGLRVSELLALLGMMLTSMAWRFESPNRSGIRSWASARRKPQPNPFRWTSIWLKIFCAGGVQVHTRWRVIGSLQVRA